MLYARNAAALGVLDRLYLADVWVGLVLPPIGAVLVRRPSTYRLGGVLLSGSMLALTNVAGQYATFVVAVRGHRTFASDAASWVAAWAWTPYLLIPTLVPLLFPTGQALTRRWSAFARFVVYVVIVTTPCGPLRQAATTASPACTTRSRSRVPPGSPQLRAA